MWRGKRQRRDVTEEPFQEDQADQDGKQEQQGNGRCDEGAKRIKKSASGKITKVFFPKPVQVKGKKVMDRVTGQRRSGKVVIGGMKWSITLLSFDLDLFEHEVVGFEAVKQDARFDSKEDPLHTAETVKTRTIKFTTTNQALVVQKLLDATFDPDVADFVADDRGLAELALLTEWNPSTHSLEDFLTHASDASPSGNKKWAKLMLDNQLVWTCILCQDGQLEKLINYFPMRTFSQDSTWTSSTLAKLLRQIESDPYPLFFANRIIDLGLPRQLPELRWQRLLDADRARLTPQQIIDIWMYTSLTLNYETTGSSFGHLKKRGRQVWVKLPSSRQDSLIVHRQRFADALNARQLAASIPIAEHVYLPDSSRGDYGPSLERLQKQGSLYLLSLSASGGLSNVNDEDFVGTVHPVAAWNVALEIATLLRDLAEEMGKKPVKFQPYDQDAGLCDEQKVALRMIESFPVSILTGPGGSGKTEVISRMRNHPDMASLATTTMVDDMTSGGAATSTTTTTTARDTKLVVTPTGISALEAKGRGNAASMTIHRVLTCIKHDMVTEFRDRQYLVIDESGMVDEQLLLGMLRAWKEHVPDKRRIVFVGDPRQLACIGPGQILKDMIGSWIPCTELKEIHRTAKEAQVLAANAKRIAAGDDQTLDFSLPCCKLVHMDRWPLEHVYLEYKGRFDTMQMVCYTNKCRQMINDTFMLEAGFLRRMYASAKDEEEAKTALHVGQKVVFTKNVKQEQHGIDVCNGQFDMVDGVYLLTDNFAYPVTPSEDAKRRPVQDDIKAREAKQVYETKLHAAKKMMEFGSRAQTSADGLPEGYAWWIKFRFATTDRPVRLTSKLRGIIEPGYAVTLHSLQGGGVDHVILWDWGSGYTKLWNEFLYTWITRARKSATFVTDASTPTTRILLSMNEHEPTRYTSLRMHLGTDPARWPEFVDPCTECGKAIKWTYQGNSVPPMSLVCDACIGP